MSAYATLQAHDRAARAASQTEAAATPPEPPLYDPETYTLSGPNGQRIVTRMLHRLFTCLTKRAGRVVHPEVICTSLWPDEEANSGLRGRGRPIGSTRKPGEFVDQASSLRVHIWQARRMLEDVGATARIVAITNLGYMLVLNGERVVKGRIK